MIIATIVGLVAFGIAWVARPIFDKWSRIRGFRFVASTLKSFELAKHTVERFPATSDFVYAPQREFGNAMFPKLVELAQTQEDLIWIMNNCHFSGGHDHPAFVKYMEKRQTSPWANPEPVVPKTRVATSGICGESN